MGTIVLIHLFNDRSGSPKVLSQTIKVLKHKGFSTELMTSGHRDGFLTDTADTQRTLFYRRSENKFLTLLYYIVSQILLFVQCLKYWNKDVLFYLNTMMPFGAALAAKLMGKQVYWHIHETSIKPKIMKQFLRLVISLTADKVIFVSRYLQEIEGFKNKKQFVIYNALDADMSIPEPQKSEHSTFNILMVCSLKKYKGVLEFLVLAGSMENQPNIRFSLVLNALSEEIDDYLHGIKIPDNVTIHARQSDVSSFYNEADVLLNLSRPDEWIETFGLTILEGMMHGLPVIVPPVGGPSEIIRDNEEGFLLSCYETEKISEKIILMVNSKTEYQRLSQNARARSKDFSQAAFEQNMAQLLEDDK